MTVDVTLVVAVLVTDDVAEDDTDVVAVVLTLDVWVDVTVVLSHVRPDPSSKLSIATFSAATSDVHADAASTTPSGVQVNSPAALCKKSPTWNSLIIWFSTAIAAAHVSADECLMKNPPSVSAHANRSFVDPPQSPSIASNWLVCVVQWCSGFGRNK